MKRLSFGLFERSGGRSMISMRLALAGIILLVLIPTLGVVSIALRNAGESYRVSSMNQLRETANVVAQSIESQLQSAGRTVGGYGLMQRGLHEGHDSGEAERWLYSAFGKGSFYRIMLRDSGAETALASSSGIPALDALALNLVRSNGPRLSNIIDEVSSEGTALKVAMAAAAERNEDGLTEVDVILASPDALTQRLSRQAVSRDAVVLAVTDGAGRIIGRSRDVDKFMGQPVPDWKTLEALGTDGGVFEASTIEGSKIVFAFQKIPDTPGWVAVAGEPLAVFNSRWQKPLIIMAAASAATILVSTILAWLLARNILAPIRYLMRHAKRVAETRGEGEPVEVPPSFVLEFETLRTSLAASEAELRRRIAESHQAMLEAEKSLAAMRRAESLSRLGSWSLDLDTLEFTSSEMLSRLNGTDPLGVPLKLSDLKDMMLPEDMARVNAAIENCIATGEPYALEVTHLRKDGASFRASLLGGPLYDETGKLSGLSGTLQDISERHEQMARLAMLADNLPNGAVFRLERNADGKLKTSYVSAGIEKLTGITPAEMIENRQHLLEAMLPEDRTGYEEALECFIAGDGAFDHEFRLLRRDGALVWLQVRAARHTLLDGHTVWDGIVLDITPEKNSARALKEAKEAAELAEQAKGDFLATMSHEIRTPMNAVMGMTRLTLQTDLTAKQRNYLEKIDSSARLLLAIINDILDFSKVEAGGLALEQTEFTLESVLESVSAITAIRAEEKELEVIFSVAPDVPRAVMGDPLRLGQVLTNLVSNAVKFTEKGEIAVSVKTVPGHAPFMLRFEVRDTGIGMSREQMEKLFRPFTQAERATSRKYGGTGLGLAISKRLVGLMGGEISVVSALDQGATFTFTAVFAPVEREDERQAGLPSAPQRLKGLRVLIVDDNESARLALTAMVTGLGMEVETCSSGMEALSLLHGRAARGQLPHDVVLMDWRMPQLDGLETARRLRSDASLARMPAVLMVTAYGREEILRGAEQIGLQGVLIKPVTQSVLYNTMSDILVPSTPAGAESVGTAAREALEGDIVRTLHGKRALLVDDNALNREVGSDFLTAVGMEVETATNGAEALEKLAENRFDVVLMDVHMPVMDGLAAVRRIRQNPLWRNLPVISLTAQASLEDRRASLEAGMTAHLTKPIDEDALYRTLSGLVGADAAGQAGNSVVTDEDGPLDLSGILRRFGGNADRLKRLLDGFLRDFGTAPQLFDAAFEAKDAENIASLAHQMKGSAGYLNVPAFCETAEKLEMAARGGDFATLAEPFAPFRLSLPDLLQKVRQASTSLSRTGKGSDGGNVKNLIMRAIPLVEAGDYGAMSLLEQIGNDLGAGEGQALARKAQASFEDLDLEETQASLRALERHMQEKDSI